MMKLKMWPEKSLIDPRASARRLITLLAVLLVAVSLCACDRQQSPTSPPDFAIGNRIISNQPVLPPQPARQSDVEFDHLTPENGLSQSTVRAMIQDRQGFMWFGTEDGLNRFDGYGFTVFKNDPADPQTLAGNTISALYEDKDGTLWIGTEGAGLDRFDRQTERFAHFRYSADDARTIGSDFISVIGEDNRGNLWIGTNNGLNRFDKETGQFTRYTNEIDPLYGQHNSNTITDIHQDQTGILWVGTLGGLLIYDEQEELFTLFPLIKPIRPRIPEGQENARVSSIHEDPSGDLWVGTLGNGLFRLDGESRSVTQYPHHVNAPLGLSHAVVYDVLRDQSGMLWVGTEGGLDMLDPDSSRFLHFRKDPGQPQSLSNDTVRSLFVDEAGILWIGTEAGGLSKYDPYRKHFFTVRANYEEPDKGLNDDMVWSLFEDSSGQLWVGTENGLDRWNREEGLFIHYTIPGNGQGDGNTRVTDIFEDSAGALWLGTLGGLVNFNRDDESMTVYNHDPENDASLSSDLITSLCEDAMGNLWVGTAGAGLNNFDRKSGRSTRYIYRQGEQQPAMLMQNHLNDIHAGLNGKLWLATQAGLALMEPSPVSSGNALTYYRHDDSNPNSLSHDQVNTIHEDDLGKLWLATGYGLDKFDPTTGRASHFTEDDGLANNMVLGILEDETGNLWLSTNRGLSRFNPHNGQFRNYDTQAGLQALEFNPGAFFKSKSGEMFFGGINGFNTFRPQQISDNPYTPPLIITGLEILNKPVTPGPSSLLEKPLFQTSAIILDRSDTVFSFELAALHYSSPADNQYAYIMEGFDNEWNLVGNRRFATYTNLPPGNYTFKAIGTNSDGTWNLNPVTLNITMPYPFWRTWWFVALALIAVLATVFATYRLRTRNIATRTRVLEEQVVERTSEIERRRQIAEGLREIMIILNSNRSLEESLHYIVSQAARLTDAEDTIIYRHKREGQPAIVATNPGGFIRYSPDAALVSLIQAWATRPLQKNEPLIIPDLDTYWSLRPGVQPATLGAHRAALGIPLFLGDQIYGGLILFYNRERSFSDEDLELGFTFADQAALAIANDQLREQAKLTAVASERSRLARDLHDAVTQTLFSASLIAEALPAIWANNSHQGRQLLQELRQLTRGALAEMRTLLLELRPAALEESKLSDLIHQLAEAVVGRTGIPVAITVDCPQKLPAGVRVALYRIAQESLNNVVKHARASQVSLSLTGSTNGVTLWVKDNGRGFDPLQVSGDHLGLDIIHERAEAIGAELSINSQIGQGTEVVVSWIEEPENGIIDEMNPGLFKEM